jgi:hypothetical protein
MTRIGSQRHKKKMQAIAPVQPMKMDVCVDSGLKEAFSGRFLRKHEPQTVT